MSKPRFFVEVNIEKSVDITGSDARHIKDVLRLGPGDVIEVVGSGESLADVEITSVSANKVAGKVVKIHEIKETLPEIYLFQALPKAGKMDMIIRQSTEIGVAGVFPVLTERVIVKIEPGRAGKKVERWQKIATEAAKQSHRMRIPKVSSILSWREALDKLKEFNQVIVFWELERERLPYEIITPPFGKIAIVIGAEGGLTQQEVLDLKEIRAEAVTLGESILRVETAGPVATAIVLYDLRRMIKEVGKLPYRSFK